MYPCTWQSSPCFQIALEINLQFTDVSELIKLQLHRRRQIGAMGSDQIPFSGWQEGRILLPGALKRYQGLCGAAAPLPCPESCTPGTKGSGDVSAVPGPAPTGAMSHSSWGLGLAQPSPMGHPHCLTIPCMAQTFPPGMAPVLSFSLLFSLG